MTQNNNNLKEHDYDFSFDKSHDIGIENLCPIKCCSFSIAFKKTVNTIAIKKHRKFYSARISVG